MSHTAKVPMSSRGDLGPWTPRIVYFGMILEYIMVSQVLYTWKVRQVTKIPEGAKVPNCNCGTMCRADALGCKLCKGDKQRHQQIRTSSHPENICVPSFARAYQAMLSKAVATSVHHFGPLGKRGKRFKEGRTCKFFKSFDGDWLNVLVPLQTLYVVAGRPLGKNCKWEGPDWYRDSALVKWLTVLQNTI